MTFNISFVSSRMAISLGISALLGLAIIGQAQAAASAPAVAGPGVVESVKDGVQRAATATGAAITKTGEAIDANVPRTEAYKKAHPEDRRLHKKKNKKKNKHAKKAKAKAKAKANAKASAAQ